MSYRVVTHNGKPHLDEIIGITLLSIYKNELPTEIIRIHPEDAAKMVKNGETAPDIYFIDCGLQLDTDKQLFDHHQSKELGCSALLIFEHYFPELKDTKLHSFINLVSDVDTMGPNAIDGFDKDSQTVKYFGFTQKIILRQFETSPLDVIRLYQNGIIDMLDFEKEKEKAKKWLETSGSISISSFDNYNILRYLNPPPKEISSAVKSIDSDIIDKENIHIIYSFDKDNNDVRTLFRTLKGDKLVDFSKAKVTNTQFCHQGGFLLKFIPEHEDEWINIIKDSVL